MPSIDVGRIEDVGVVGAGTMGSGIAQVFLKAGCRVRLHDASGPRMEEAGARVRAGLKRWADGGKIPDLEEASGRLALTHDLFGLQDCQWIVEAISEDLEAKSALLGTLGRLCRPETVLATNTSTISITALGSASGRPERTVGMHFFNPAPVMRLVEVVPGLRTDPDVVAATRAFAERLEKVSVLSRDRPGFISNRILAPMINEAIWALEEGVGTAEEIDQVMKLGMNHPMGPLALADFIGLDICLAILEVLHHEFGDPKYRACPLLKKHVEAGWLGRKTGRGFYPYER